MSRKYVITRYSICLMTRRPIRKEEKKWRRRIRTFYTCPHKLYLLKSSKDDGVSLQGDYYCLEQIFALNYKDLFVPPRISSRIIVLYYTNWMCGGIFLLLSFFFNFFFCVCVCCFLLLLLLLSLSFFPYNLFSFPYLLLPFLPTSGPLAPPSRFLAMEQKDNCMTIFHFIGNSSILVLLRIFNGALISTLKQTC